MEVILFVCLLADPTKCKEERLPMNADVEHPGRCAVVSTLYMAQWMGDHPTWKVVRWKCGRAGERSL